MSPGDDPFRLTREMAVVRRDDREGSAEERIIGQSPPVQRLRRLIRRVGPTEATVLIVGERGSGKELVADALQEGSGRRPYVKVNCAAIQPDLLASELFGHERGAFTGALERKPGLLAAADGGTLFLDEVGDLSLAAQAMLLRFLEDGEVRPVGSTQTFHTEVRLLAATNKDLTGEMTRKRFRADLYDRLSEVVLEVPPLRERREDIPLLVGHFLVLYSQRHGGPLRNITASALRALQRYPWPGNVRELKKTVRRAVIFVETEWIQPKDLGLPALDEVSRSPMACGSPSDGDDAPVPALTLRQREALGLVSRYGAVRRADLVARFGISGKTARLDLVALVQAGYLRRSGNGRGASYCPAGGPRAASWQTLPSSASS